MKYEIIFNFYQHFKLISLFLNKFLARTRQRKSAFSIKQSVIEKISSVEKPSVKNKNPRILFSKTSELTPIASNLFRCAQNKTEIECRNKTNEFKNKVVKELTKSMMISGDENNYNIDYVR